MLSFHINTTITSITTAAVSVALTCIAATIIAPTVFMVGIILRLLLLLIHHCLTTDSAVIDPLSQ